MKVLFEELSAPKRAGGIDMATAELAKHLRAIGVEVSRTAEHEGGKVGKCESNRPDVVHVQGIWSPRLARSVLKWRRRGVPCLISPHGMLAPWALSHKRLKKVVAWWLYQKYVLNRASCLHGTSAKETAQFTRVGLRGPAMVIPWGVDLPPGIERNSSGGKRIALFIGRIYPVKGLPMLVEAWARVKPRGWHLKIAGPDEAGHQAELEAAVEARGLRGEVEFAGPLEGTAKHEAFLGASLVVQPSYTENFGMSVAEGLAYSLPVITTTGTPWEELKTHRCGWWVEPTVDSLAVALQDAVNRTPAELAEMGARGRQLVEEHYTWENTALRMKETYQKLSSRS